ncbi:retropepsin-like aspartic protease [Micromonospora sp. NPDC003241]
MEGIPEVGITCLVDSGALYNRFDERFAKLAGLNLDGLEPTERFAVGGNSYVGRTTNVQLTLGGFTWDAPICFISDWDRDFQLLGQEGFFRWFEVSFFAADHFLTVEPASH